MNSPEVREIPRIDVINNYLDESILEIKSILQKMEELIHPDCEMLNKVFLEELNR